MSLKFQSVYQNLNERQREAVDIIYGPVLCIAGPGTGKTQLLASRISQMLLSEAQINPYNILCLTFTNAGAVAMRQRLFDFIGPTAYQVEVGTFHSFCNDVVMSHADMFGVRELEPVSQLESIEILYNIIDTLPMGHGLKRYRGDVYYESTRMAKLFQMMKEEGWSFEFLREKMNDYLLSLPEQEDYRYKRADPKRGIAVGDLKKDKIAAEQEKCEKTVLAAELFTRYNDMLISRKRYDFSDMIHWVIRAFESNKPFLSTYQERFQYILVDEFQDTNGSQMKLLHLLLNYWESPNVFVVGDDDQALYEFNGARIANMIDFQRKYNPKVIVLDKNYRSFKRILDYSGQLIDNNVQRIINYQKDFPADAKKLIAMKEYKEMQPNVYFTINSFETPRSEELGAYHRILDLIDNKVDPKEIAVLYRKHKQADRMIRLLKEKNIPVFIRREENALENRVVSQLLNIIILLSGNISDNISLLFQVLHYPFFKVNVGELEAGFVQNKKDRSQDVNYDFSIENVMKSFSTPIQEVIKMLQEMQQEKYYLPFIEYVRYIMTKTGMLDYVYGKDDSLANVNAISSFFTFVKDEIFRDPVMDDAVFLHKIFKMIQNDVRIPTENLDFDDNGVVLSTVHGAKGLEWDHVFIIGAIRSEWEKSRKGGNNFYLSPNITFSVDEDQIESNRRLFYVAMTRAKKSLAISYHMRDDNKKEVEPTQFLTEFKYDHITKMRIEPEDMVKGAMIDLYFQDFKPKVKDRIISEALEGFRMSISAMNKYLSCRVAFYYENVIRVPFVADENLIYGSAVHIAMKNLYDHWKETGKILPMSDAVKFFQSYLLKNVGQIGEQSYRRRLELGQKVLFAFYRERFENSNKIVLTEYTVKSIIEDVPFIYVFDKLEFVGNNVDCVDYKTGSLKGFEDHCHEPNEKEPFGGDYWRQAIGGKLMLNSVQSKPWRFNSFRFEVLDDPMPQPKFIEIAPEDEKLFIRLVKETYNNINDHIFAPGCGECMWCKMNELSNT